MDQRFHRSAIVILGAAQTPQQRAKYQGQDHDADDVVGRKGLEHRARDVGSDFLERMAVGSKATSGG
jgi:hypothetical protein